jgi:methionyl-tRNA formyltransferase
VQWSIFQGETVTGVTTMFTDAGIDTGDMLLQKKVEILPEETAGQLTERLSHVGAQLLLETIALLEKGQCPRTPQDHSQMTYDSKITKEMGVMDFSETTAQCLCRIRAMSPWPCAYVQLEEGALKIWRGKAAEGHGQPGTVLCADRKKGLIVATGDGAIELCEIQAPGAKRMEAKAYLLGHSIPEGVKLDEVRL